MNRSLYFDYIESKLNLLALRINSRNRLNILDLNIHAETFYARFFNLLFSWELENVNAIRHNVESMDLIDNKNKILVQVSATATKAKIESTLSKSVLLNYSGYTFKFIFISETVPSLRNNTFANPYGVKFSPSNDIFDTQTILRDVLSQSANKQREVYEFIRKELGNDIDAVKLESNLAMVINLLSKENWNVEESTINTNGFEIDRKITYNQLDSAKTIIDDYKIHYGRIDRIYSEFDASGYNKSKSVLDNMRTIYVTSKKENKSADDLFFDIADKTRVKIQNSANFRTIPVDELELCVHILVADAFIRCKIFDNPNDYAHVAAG